MSSVKCTPVRHRFLLRYYTYYIINVVNVNLWTISGVVCVENRRRHYSLRVNPK